MKIMPVQKQTPAGQRTRFNGHVGLGVKCSKEVATAIRGAIILAKLSVIPVRRGYWGNKIGTGKCGSVPCTAPGWNCCCSGPKEGASVCRYRSRMCSLLPVDPLRPLETLSRVIKYFDGNECSGHWWHARHRRILNFSRHAIVDDLVPKYTYGRELRSIELNGRIQEWQGKGFQVQHACDLALKTQRNFCTIACYNTNGTICRIP